MKNNKSQFSKILGTSAMLSFLLGQALSEASPPVTIPDEVVPLGYLGEGNFYSNAYGVSADGTVVVGQSESIGGEEAFGWTQRGGMVGLGTLNDEGKTHSIAYGISADGMTIVGGSTSNDGYQAFRWTPSDGGMVGLGDLDGGNFYSTARTISADGSVVVGESNSSNGFEAFRWTEVSGIQSLNQWLAEEDVETSGIRFTEAYGVSADGNIVVGTGYFNKGGQEAFLARGGSGAISLEEFTQSFGTTASIQQTALSLPGVIMNGSHHRVLLEQDFADQSNMVWANGDFANHSDRDAEILTGEVGIAHDFAPGLRAGFGVGYGELDQDLSNEGQHQLDGQYIMAEVDYLIPETSVILSLTGFYGDWKADIKRGYLNLGTSDSSKGDTDVDTLSVRLRADWVDAFELGDFTFSPRIAYTLTRIETDSYTETGGGFPVQFNSMSHTSNEIRAGLTAENVLNDNTTVRGIVELVHRIDQDNDDFSGQVIGLFPFSIDGQENEQTWGRLGADISHKLRDDLILTATLFGASDGEDPSFSGGLNLSYLF